MHNVAAAAVACAHSLATKIAAQPKIIKQPMVELNWGNVIILKVHSTLAKGVIKAHAHAHKHISHMVPLIIMKTLFQIKDS